MNQNEEFSPETVDIISTEFTNYTILVKDLYIIAEDENLTMESYLQKLESDQSLNLNRDFFTINLSTMEIHELTILPINESYFLDELIHNALESQG